MKNLVARIKAYVLAEEERVLFQLGVVLYAVGLPISISFTEIGKACIGLAFIIALVRGKVRLDFKRDRVLLFATALFAAIVISHVFAPRFLESLQDTPLHYAFLFLGFRYLFSFKKDKALLVPLFVAMLVNAAIPLRPLAGVLPFKEVKTLSPILIHAIRTGGVRNGGYLGMVMSAVDVWLALTFVNTALVVYVRHRVGKALFALLLLVNIATIIAMQSSTSFVIFPLLFVTLLVIYTPPKTGTLIVFTALFVVIVTIFAFDHGMFPKPLETRIRTVLASRPESLNQREYFFKGSMELAMKRPLTGVGAGAWPHYFYEETEAGRAFQKAYAKYSLAHLTAWLWHAHNNVFHVAAEFGLLALIAFILLLVFVFYDGYRFLQEVSSLREYPLLVALFVALASLTLQGMTEYTLFSATGGNAFWGILGIYFAMLRTDPPAKDDEKTKDEKIPSLSCP